MASSPAVSLAGDILGGRIAAFCNSYQCDQRYWFFPASGRVTRRNTGDTYQERYDPLVLIRQDIDPKPMMFHPSAPTRPDLDSDPGVKVWEGNIAAPFKAAWYWVRAFFVVYVPGFGRFGAHDD